MKSSVDFANQVKAYSAAAKSIAPVENGTTAVGSYKIGEQFMRDGVIYKAKTAITAGDTLTLDTNYEAEDNIETQLSDVKQALSNEVNTRAELGAHNLAADVKNGTGTQYDAALFIEAELKADTEYTLSFKATSGLVYYTNTNLFTSAQTVTGTGNTQTLKVKTNSSISKSTANQYSSGYGWRVLQNSAAQATPSFTEVMITLATDANVAYQPYTMSNRELTEALKWEKLTGLTADGTVVKSIESNECYKNDALGVAIININVKAGTFGNFATAVTGFPAPKSNVTISGLHNNNAGPIVGFIRTAGDLMFDKASTTVAENDVVSFMGVYNY